MLLTIMDAFNPVWGDPDGKSINLLVKFAEFNEPLSFLAHTSDSEPHGRLLYNNAAAGMYGRVAPYPIPDFQQLINLQASLCSKVDATAEQIRLKYLTPGSGQAMVYQEKAIEALAIQTDPNPTNDKYPVLAASLGIEGGTLLAVANLVLSIRATWINVATAIEATRLGAKANINAATTIAAANTIYNSIVWPY